MRELLLIARIYMGRIALCMAAAWLFYNPWLSLFTWLWPQASDMSVLQHGWPLKLFVGVLAFGFATAVIVTVKVAMGVFWSLVVVAAASLLAYLPFYFDLVDPTSRNGGFAAWFFVLPVLFGSGLSAGYVVRYARGTLMTQHIGDGAAHHTDVPVHHA